MTHTLPSLRGVAIEVVREAQSAMRDGGDSPRVATFIRRRTESWPRRERERLTATLALVAASLAARVPPVELEELLGMLAKSDVELLELASQRMLARSG